MKDDKDMKDYIFVGCMFIGMGVGYYIGNLLVGMFIGMGVGFIASVIFKSK